MNKEIKEILQTNRQLLEESQQDLKAIFHIMFHRSDYVLCETNDGFQIRKTTYGQMRQQIEKAAAALYARIGARHSYIALEMENCPQWIVAFWAILMSGNKPYLVNTRYPVQLSDGILKTLQVVHILCLETTALAGTPICMSQLTGEHPAVPEQVFENEIAFSSSATSMNEVICFYTGKQIAAQILNFKDIVKCGPRIAKHYKGSIKQLAFLPFYHVFGLFAVYFWFTFFARTLVFLRDYAADTILATCRRHQVTHIFAVPMLWHTIEKQVFAEAKKQGPKQEKKLRRGLKLATKLQNLFPKHGPELAKRLMKQVTGKLFGPSVIFCINGGSYLRDSAMELLNGIGYCMHNGYGMSEIGITSVELRSRPKDRNKNSVGRPFASVQYRLDEEGILQVRGTSLCVKKLVNGRQMEQTQWFDTGDYMCQQEGHYFIQGRRSDTVIGENGENINPDAVEKLFTLGKAKAFSVLGLPGENGQELAMVVQISPYATEAMVETLKQDIYAINATLPTASAVKKVYVTCQELAPPTAVKISRAQLEKKIREGQVTLTPIGQFRHSARDDAQESLLLQQVRRIVAQVLELELSAVTAQAHIFYDLGATSIQYFSILSALAEHFEITSYEKTDSYCYTPQQISDYIEKSL